LSVTYKHAHNFECKFHIVLIICYLNNLNAVINRLIINILKANFGANKLQKKIIKIFSKKEMVCRFENYIFTAILVC